ncbi:hypothetical protein FNN08_10945 [Thalassomonas sp. M1454]|nr:hypothetical protein FNN08_10945 [Thalassomonas sp. M1454]
MWSGPRNISTAMMRSWENRSDTQVIDEPFYAYYLANTTVPHPMQESILLSQPIKWPSVVEQLTETPPTEIFYQKHMTHHMLDDIDLTWTKDLSHCFLIRDPLHVVNSYVKKMPTVCSADIGIARQYQLYQQLCEISGQQIPIIDGKDVLLNPRGILSKLCAELGIEFSERMLSWPKGARESDGVWAEHWYENVENSTCFAEFVEPKINLTEEQKAVADANRDYYLELFNQRIKLD